MHMHICFHILDGNALFMLTYSHRPNPPQLSAIVWNFCTLRLHWIFQFRFWTHWVGKESWIQCARALQPAINFSDDGSNKRQQQEKNSSPPKFISSYKYGSHSLFGRIICSFFLRERKKYRTFLWSYFKWISLLFHSPASNSFVYRRFGVFFSAAAFFSWLILSKIWSRSLMHKHFL